MDLRGALSSGNEAARLLTVASIANVASGRCGSALTMSDREGAVAGLQAVSVLLRILLGTAAALTFSLLGLTMGASVLAVTTFALMWWQARRLLGILRRSSGLSQAFPSNILVTEASSKTLSRTAFGFHNANAMIAIAMLSLGRQRPALPGR